MRVAVLGGCGGIGRSLVSALLAQGDDVMVLDLAASLERHSPPPGVTGVAVDGSDAASVASAFAAVAALWGALDGFVNLAFGEQCDSSGANTATCDANCTIPVCGDGTVNMAAGEDCDDMNNLNTDACRNDCKFNTCGDGFTDSSDEMCDDGNIMNESECPYGTQSCQLCSMNCMMLRTLRASVAPTWYMDVFFFSSHHAGTSSQLSSCSSSSFGSFASVRSAFRNPSR